MNLGDVLLMANVLVLVGIARYLYTFSRRLFDEMRVLRDATVAAAAHAAAVAADLAADRARP